MHSVTVTLVADDGVSMLGESSRSDLLGQNVRNIRISVNLSNFQDSLLHHVSDVVVTNFHVLHASVEASGVHGVADSCRAVAEHGEGLRATLLLFVWKCSKMMSWLNLVWSDVR